MKPFFRALLALISTLALNQVKAADTVYFLVAEPPGRIAHNDSYVLPLSNQEDIDHARYLITLGRSVFSAPHDALVVANVVAATNDINRNFLDQKFPKWSWEVSEFLQFQDYTIEIMDGTPSQLEPFDGSRGAQTTIGFWNYTVVRELGPLPLYLSIVPGEENLQFYWSGLGSNYLYTLESKEAVASTNWLTLPGASWPQKTNHWTLPLTNNPAPFYRVKAEQSKD